MITRRLTPSSGSAQAAADAGNLRAVLLMTIAMALFALEDAAIKILTVRLPVGQIIAMIGALGCLTFWALLAREGGRLVTRDMRHPVFLLRAGGEMVGTLGFVSALALTPLASASAILQALPLALVLGAALFLGERVGWRRWLAIAAGFAGVLLIVRPGTAGFEPLSLLALVGVIGLAARDLATRRMPRHIPSHQLSAAAYGILVPSGLVLAALQGTPFVMLDRAEALALAFCWIVGVLGYAAMVLATRVGEASLIAPLRYTRLVFTLILAVVVFGERPDAPTLIGAAIICGAGVFAMWREIVQTRARRP